jgi:hypothetical protein
MYKRQFFQKNLTLQANVLFFGQDPEVGRERAPFRLGAQLFDRAGAQCIHAANRFAKQPADRGHVETIDVLQPQRCDLPTGARVLAKELD